MTPLFTPLEEAQAIIYCKPGTYRQAPLFERGGHLYARYGTGYVKIYAEGGTSHPSVRCDPENIDLGQSGYRLVRNGHLWKVAPEAEAA